ncbi:MAG: 3-isopropylmalate dehydratase [Deltaproteobacteria bacterium]|nr:3-isopropylmalate dehydratase [Deltaproteobacteria bacterium]
MSTIIRGKVLKLGDNINTDYIIPARYLDLYEPEDLGPHVFEEYGAYRDRLRGHSIVIGGEDFGLGSAREQAPNALKGGGVEVVVAKSFARIFYRNTLNVGVAAIECPEAAEAAVEDEEITIDLERGAIEAGKRTFRFPAIPREVRELLDAGGMVPYLKRKWGLM